MNRDGRSSSNDPTSEPVSDQSTQSASGLSGARSGPGVERNRQTDGDEVVDRSGSANTPRRYEQPVEEDEDLVMPSDDSTVNTKI
jgi:hypothetical protein